MRCHYRNSEQQHFLRIALISAFDLRRHPENITENAAFLEITLRSDAEHLPLKGKFDIIRGNAMTMKDFRLIMEGIGNPDIYEGYESGHAHMVSRGFLGLGVLLFKVDDIFDAVQLVMPSVNEMRAMPDSVDWGSDWVRG
jgi:hypothetical protein